MRKFILPVLLLILASLACGLSTPTSTPAPTLDLNAIVSSTLAAYTLEAALTQIAIPSLTPSLPLPSETALPPVFTSTPMENAPDPLPAFNTGQILNNGECFNFDNGQVSLPDTQCDVWLAEPALFRKVNASQLSGYVTFEPPSRTHCLEGRYEPGDLAIQTDLFMCFITSEGYPGFIVARDYLGGIPSTGIVFDYWVFK